MLRYGGAPFLDPTGYIDPHRADIIEGHKQKQFILDKQGPPITSIPVRTWLESGYNPHIRELFDKLEAADQQYKYIGPREFGISLLLESANFFREKDPTIDEREQVAYENTSPNIGEKVQRVGVCAVHDANIYAIQSLVVPLKNIKRVDYAETLRVDLFPDNVFMIYAPLKVPSNQSAPVQGVLSIVKLIMNT
jgi:hypothetical protein